MTVKVNLDNVLKEHLYNGAKGTYLDLVLFNTPDNQFGDDFVVKQDLSKEVRDNGTEAPILGNGKVWELGGAKNPGKDQGAPPPVAPSTPSAPSSFNDNLPF